MVTGQDSELPGNHRGRRKYLLLGLGMVALSGLLYLGIKFREREPNYYSPARAALVNARLRFEESLAHEQQLMAQLEKAHQELDSAMDKLALAANLDPADRVRIEELRSHLLAMENADGVNESTPRQLHRRYRELLTQMDALITDLEKRAR